MKYENKNAMMKSCRRWIAGILAAVSIWNLSAVAAVAEEAEMTEMTENPDSISGTWEGLQYVIENHVLTISGKGEIQTMRFMDFYVPEFYVYYDDITEIVLEEGITGVGIDGLSGYPHLKKVTLPSTLTSLAPYALEGNPELTEINGLEYVTDFHFHCLSQTAYIQENPFVIHDNALYYAEGTDFVVPDGVEEIKSFAFGNCTDADFIDMDGNISEEPEERYINLELQHYTVTLPESVTKIDDFAFACCSTMTEINIPASVQSIGEYAFYNCTELEIRSLPAQLESVGKFAFFNCRNLENLIVRNPKTIFQEQAIGAGINWEATIQTMEESMWKEKYWRVYTCEPLALDYMLSACAVSLLDVREYGTVMENIRDIWENGEVEPEIILENQGTLTGYVYSTAMTFAQENGLAFQMLVSGDVNADGNTDILDVILVNKAILGKYRMTPEQAAEADMDGSDVTEPADSILIMKRVVNLI